LLCCLAFISFWSPFALALVPGMALGYFLRWLNDSSRRQQQMRLSRSPWKFAVAVPV